MKSFVFKIVAIKLLNSGGYKESLFIIMWICNIVYCVLIFSLCKAKNKTWCKCFLKNEILFSFQDLAIKTIVLLMFSILKYNMRNVFKTSHIFIEYSNYITLIINYYFFWKLLFMKTLIMISFLILTANIWMIFIYFFLQSKFFVFLGKVLKFSRFDIGIVIYRERKKKQ